VANYSGGSGNDLGLVWASNRAFAWGQNVSGQLGDNTMTTARLAPVPVTTTGVLAGKTVVAIAAGGSAPNAGHSLAVCSDGTVAAWGWNSYGQLGDNSTTTRRTPMAVSTTPLVPSQRLTRVASSSSAFHTLAMVAAPPASEITLTGAQTLNNGSFKFSFTNTTGAIFGVLAATHQALPLGNWTSLTGLTEVTPGRFQFTDPQATTNQQRFYRVHSP